MKILIVYAHHEPKSFNGALKELAISVLKKQGHDVKYSDLYAMNFNPVADKGDFSEMANPAALQYIMEQKNASEKGLFADEIQKEQEKVRWADFIIFQCPVWWFSVPAILKGWFDRVLAAGFAWDFGRMYDKGLLVGKKAMLSVTTGGPEIFYAPDAPHGLDINQLLYPVNHGVLYFCGIQPIPPFFAFAVFQIGDEKRKEYLEQYRQRLLTLESTAPIAYHRLSDFDENMQLKS